MILQDRYKLRKIKEEPKMAKSFIQVKSSLDDIREEKDAALKKAGKEIAKFLSGAGSEGEKSATIDKLLIGFSDADKFVIMKYAFLGMC